MSYRITSSCIILEMVDLVLNLWFGFCLFEDDDYCFMIFEDNILTGEMKAIYYIFSIKLQSNLI